jgi:fructose-1,6-bisphosphatase I
MKGIMFIFKGKDYIKYCQFEEGDRPYFKVHRKSVSDIHRNMIKGGIYLYPTSSKAPKGKLRLLWCNPLAFITEQAGGSFRRF